MLMMYGSDFSHPQGEKSYDLMDHIIEGLIPAAFNFQIEYGTFQDFMMSLSLSADELDV
jgi:hypothetical protein